MNSIHNVVSVCRITCSSLGDMQRIKDSVLSLPDNGWSDIDIRVPAKLSINNKVESGVTVYSHQLTFSTCENIEVRGHWAYKIGLADGQQLLLGSYDRPYPVTVSSRMLADNLSDSQLYEVTVTLASREDLPQIA